MRPPCQVRYSPPVALTTPSAAVTALPGMPNASTICPTLASAAARSSDSDWSTEAGVVDMDCIANGVVARRGAGWLHGNVRQQGWVTR